MHRSDEGEWVDDAEGSLSAIVGVRDELAAGDLRPLYLAWLAGYGTWERDEYAFDGEENDELEPPVPPGLRTLTAAQQALADFLRLDSDLLDVAATTSPALDAVADDPRELAGWTADLATNEKDRLLLSVVTDHPATVRMGRASLAVPFASYAERPSSCSTARRIQEDTDRSSASARRRTSSSSSAGNRTGTGSVNRARRRGRPTGT